MKVGDELTLTYPNQASLTEFTAQRWRTVVAFLHSDRD